MINDAPFTWKLRPAPIVWRIRFRDAKIAVAETDLTIGFIPSFSGIDIGNSVVGDFILGTAAWADTGFAVLPPINFIWPGMQYFLPGDSSVVGEALVGGNNMGAVNGDLRS